ncbi:LuxR C-terminal-related transcriptional regulator [Microbacterium suwonense]|uniref:HTH luxR-type domain-containing protein n=1 Tax=Microbacterium suwonense TaxID=683047 RepID=A0ABM8FQ78_9MICO|nr:LuxR C-terminal-related transcriptional regulator [Microbacterium suwonense]BDZ37559.1 hypothetical protein GCM10025863_01730 [Microbacterium suwonense]
MASPQREDLRESFAELRSIAAELTDESLRERIAAVERRLMGVAEPAQALDAEPAAHLSPRELDVLACAAVGSTNAQIATQLGLREGTVKAYLRSAMSKLDASSRHSAVVRARRAGLLPETGNSHHSESTIECADSCIHRMPRISLTHGS